MNLAATKLFNVMYDKIFRIAVCLSGQARYWKNCAENIRHYFSNTSHPTFNIPVEYDFFIHTWDTNTWRFPKQNHTNYVNEKHNDGPLIKNEFKPKGFIFEKWIQELYPRAWDSMFYSHSRSLMLKRNYEFEKNFEYDIVIKARLDVVYNPTTCFPLDDIKTRFCYTPCLSSFPFEFNYFNFDDVLFFGDSPTMDQVGDLYFSYKKRHEIEKFKLDMGSLNFDPTYYYGPGCLLYDHMTNIGVHPAVRPGIDYAVMRSTAVEKNLNSMTDYEQIKDLWRAWYI